MKKKFSTLMASVLLASAFSTSAYATPTAFSSRGVQGKPVTGDVVLLFSTSSGTLGSNTFIQMKDDGTLAEVAYGSAFQSASGDKTSFENAARTLWKVNVRYSSTTGEPIYQFINKATGAYLAIDLKTDDNGSSSAPAKLNAAGNRDWSFKGGVLYAYKGTAPNDSVFTLTLDAGKQFRLSAKAGNDPAAAASAAKVDVATIKEAIATNNPLEDNEPKLTLDATSFNAMLSLSNSDGKLHFNNSKDVSTGDKNLLTENQYVAYNQGTANTFFLAQKDKKTDVNKNPYVLMVSKEQYAAAQDAFFKFAIDTLAITKAQAETMVSAAGFTGGAPTLEFKQGYVTPVEAASFTGVYYYGNDSIALQVDGVPGKYLNNDFAITNGTVAWSTLGVDATTDAVPKKTEIKAYKDYTPATSPNDINVLKTAVDNWLTAVVDKSASEVANQLQYKFENTYFTNAGAIATSAGEKQAKDAAGVLGKAKAYVAAGSATKEEAAFVSAVEKLERKKIVTADPETKLYIAAGMPTPAAGSAQVPFITSLSSTKVLTVGLVADKAQYIQPLVQPFTTTGGDAVITTSTKLYRIQIANTTKDAVLKATAHNSKYLVATGLTAPSDPKTILVESVDDANVYAQWAFIPGEAGFYQIINRGSEFSLYSGPVSKVKDAAGNVVADTYVVGPDTLKLAGVTVTPNVYEEKGGKFDYSGYFYAGPTKDKSYTFSIAPVAAIMTNLGAQFNKDSVMVLGKSEDAPVWYFQEAGAKEYGLKIEGVTPLKYMTYNIFTKDANGDSLYVYAKENKYYVTNKGAAPVAFTLREANKGQYLFLEGANKMTINPTPAQPVLEQSAAGTMRDDYFTIESASSNAYRTLTAEDGVNGNVKIFMNNEPYRYLYENTANIVANNGNKIAKDSLNFLGIYNAAAASKNAALYVDTAYVNRKGVTMPQYMFALDVEDHEATPAADCTGSDVHVDKNGKPTTADKCVHATPAKKAYKSGRYLVSVADSASTAKHPAKYDGAYRLAFVEAIHVEGSDSLIIVNSKYTNNTNAITEGKETTYASKDTLKFENDKPNVATFALLIKDQADKSFYLETANKTYVRILNGVPVLTDNIENAAIFNIEATTEEATANEAIEAAGVQVIGGQGVVTVQGAAGKVITVANILGQTIANQVAASDNVTIAAPAGVVVVAVDGDATKVVVK